MAALGLPELLLDQMAVLAGALLLDLAVGDPPEGSRWEKLHPVVWMGNLAAAVDRRTLRGNPRRERTVGLLLALLVPTLFAGPALLLYPLRELSRGLYLLASVLLLKSAFTLKGLRDYVLAPLGVPLGEKRRRVAKVVSRDTRALEEADLHSAAIESAAENLADSVVAPLLFFALFGVPGALFYRAVNTLDAMVGYRDPRHRHLGWAAARFDDALSGVPERLAAGLIRVAGPRSSVPERAGQGPWAPSLGAVAEVLGVRLRKPQAYTILPGGREPTEDDVRRAVVVVTRAAALAAGLAFFILLLVSWAGWTWWSREFLSLI